MENPGTWGEAEKVIAAAIEENDVAHMKGIVGSSLVSRIADALRGAGLLDDDRRGADRFLAAAAEGHSSAVVLETAWDLADSLTDDDLSRQMLQNILVRGVHRP